MNVRNSIFEDLVSQSNGGGIYINYSCSISLVSNLFINCTSPNSGGGFYLGLLYEFHIKCCYLSSNEAVDGAALFCSLNEDCSFSSLNSSSFISNIMNGNVTFDSGKTVWLYSTKGIVNCDNSSYNKGYHITGLYFMFSIEQKGEYQNIYNCTAQPHGTIFQTYNNQNESILQYSNIVNNDITDSSCGTIRADSGQLKVILCYVSNNKVGKSSLFAATMNGFINVFESYIDCPFSSESVHITDPKDIGQNILHFNRCLTLKQTCQKSKFSFIIFPAFCIHFFLC